MARAKSPRKKKAVSGSAKMTVTQSYLGQPPTTTQETIQVRLFATEPAKIRYSLGRTVSSGEPYEFIRVDVGVDIPCYVEEVPRMFPKVKNFVENKLGSVLEEIDALIAGPEGVE